MSIHYYVIMGPLKHQHRSLIFFAADYIFKDCRDEQLRMIVDKAAMKQLFIVSLISGLMFFGFFLFLALPFYLLFVYGIRSILISTVLPFITLDSNWGYLLNSFNTSFVTYLAAICNIAGDSSFAVIVNNMHAGVDVVKFSIKEMVSSFERTGNRREQTSKFRNILIQIQDLDR